MTIMNRPFGGADDLQAILALIKTRPPNRITDAPSIVDIQELLALPAIQATTQVWYDPGGELAGYAFLNHPDFLFFEARPTADAGAIEAEMIAWGAAQRRASLGAQQPGLTLSTICREDNTLRIRQLTAYGFVMQPWWTVEMARRLADPIAPAQLPAGFQIRSAMGEADLPGLVKLHHSAFGTELMTVEFRRAMMQTPAYEPALDLIAIAPDGTFAAYCLCSISHEENQLTGWNEGHTDPVATHPAYQRRGLARALLLTGLQLLKDRGMDYALLHTSGENEPMQKAAGAAGYQLATKIRFFTKILDP
jgi:ribosomal protein S18 acetylase RimI-like enzyme